MKLSVVLATKNEEENIGQCLESVKGLADEIILYDEFSTDKTREIAKKYGARVFTYSHKTNFHQTKQKAIEKATGDWILQLDADERVTPELAEEIKSVINMDLNLTRHPEYISDSVFVPALKQYTTYNIQNTLRLFSRHQLLITQREGKLGKPTGDAAAFFLPRLNFFLGAPLRHAGVYPDGVIRLFKKGKARLPGKSVHELMEVDGEVGWLFNNLEHHDSPTFSRYLDRANRYTDLTAEEYKNKNISVNALYFILYTLYKPTMAFLNLYIRHLGFRDGLRGFIWSAFSALHFPIAYFKYFSSVKSPKSP